MDQVTENIWIGDIKDVLNQNFKGKGVDAVVNVSKNEVPEDVVTNVGYFHFPLNDGDASYSVFEKSVGKVVELVEGGEVVLVNCSVGVSRSASVVATAQSILQGVCLNSSLRKLEKARPCINPKPSLKNLGEKVLISKKAEDVSKTC